MKKILWVLMSISLFLAIALGGGTVWKRNSEQKLQARAEQIIQRVEDFRRQTANLPKGLTDIGEVDRESGPIYFQPETETDYSVWFGLSLGESRLYSSATQQWTTGG